MSTSSTKQSAGKLYHGNLEQGTGGGYVAVRDRDDVKISDELRRAQTDGKGVRMPRGYGKNINSNMTVVYGDQDEPILDDGGLYETHEMAQDSGFLGVPGSSKARLKKTIMEKTVNLDEGSRCSKDRLKKTIPEKTIKVNEGRSNSEVKLKKTMEQNSGNSSVDDSGFLEDSGSSKAGMKNTIKGKGGSSDNDRKIAPTSRRQKDETRPDLTMHSTAAYEDLHWIYRCFHAVWIFMKPISRLMTPKQWKYFFCGASVVVIALSVWGAWQYEVWYHQSEESDPDAMGVSDQNEVVGSTEYHYEESG